MIKYFNKIWGSGKYIPQTWKLKNGITGQKGFSNASGHVDVIFRGKAAGGILSTDHGAVYYHMNNNIKTTIWKY